MTPSIRLDLGNPEEEPPAEGRLASFDRRYWMRYALRRPLLVLSVLYLVLMALWVITPYWFASQNPVTINTASVLRGPSWAHLFGTDELGRDAFSRIVHGTGASIDASVIAVLLALAVGVLLGSISGFFGGWPDHAITRAIDVMLAVPQLLLALMIVTTIGPGTNHLAIAVGVVLVGPVARVMRSEVLKIRTAGYVEASTASGARASWILGRHVVPNSLGPVVAMSIVGLGQAVLAISALSFLGFGSPPPAPEWGALVASGRFYLSAWWLTLFPGLAIALFVIAVNRVSRLKDIR